MRYDPSYAAVPEDFASNLESLMVTLSSVVSMASFGVYVGEGMVCIE